MIKNSRNYSGIVINQNVPPENSSRFVDLTNEDWVYQTFVLPSDYVRGSGEDASTPPISGLSANVEVLNGKENVSGFEWTLDFYLFGSGWTNLSSGVLFGSPVSGDRVWITDYFAPESIPTGIEDNRMRIGIRSPQNSDPLLREPVNYDPRNLWVFIKGVRYTNILLTPGEQYDLEVDGHPGVIEYDGEVATYSHLVGVKKLWAASPNPLASSSSALYQEDGITPITFSGVGASCLFRVMGLVADSGTDALGNRFRSTISSLPVTNVMPGGSTTSSYWLSKPNPSRFAVESMHFDMRDNYNNEVTIDGLTIDPVTPGMWLNVYYTSEGDPDQSPEGWDYKLWTRVNASWKIDKRETILFPSPVVAKYIKVEFSHLQARHYSPGRFVRPVVYKKHPKWVLDYFLIRLDDYIKYVNKASANSVQISYNAYDLAFNYYLDDLSSLPDVPDQKDKDFYQRTIGFIQDRTDSSDIIDSAMLDQIYAATRPYRTGPLRSGNNDLLTTVLRANESLLSQDNPVEVPINLGIDDSPLESFAGQPIAYENDFPVMYFHIPSRHKYRTVSASFEYDRAYFAGVREIAFLRNNFTKSRDASTYIEVGADRVNTRRNDFDHGAFAKSGATIGDIGLDYFGED